jgi:hypothetical protein
MEAEHPLELEAMRAAEAPEPLPAPDPGPKA